MKLRNHCYKYVLRHMGNGCNICDGVTILRPDLLSLGNKVSIHEYTLIGGQGEITIGDNVSIAHNCSIISESHQFADPSIPIKEQGMIPQPIVIGNDVWLGAKVTILGNTKIGDGAVIGAASVVTKDIPAKAVAVGSPCRVIRFRDQLSETKKKP